MHLLLHCKMGSFLSPSSLIYEMYIMLMLSEISTIGIFLLLFFLIISAFHTSFLLFFLAWSFKLLWISLKIKLSCLFFILLVAWECWEPKGETAILQPYLQIVSLIEKSYWVFYVGVKMNLPIFSTILCFINDSERKGSSIILYV